uniref:Uncharacterized protein n=1 Tax=Arundo donax TaxID=35708 RepID=A0A0A9F7S0_ARUDO
MPLGLFLAVFASSILSSFS